MLDYILVCHPFEYRPYTARCNFIAKVGLNKMSFKSKFSRRRIKWHLNHTAIIPNQFKETSGDLIRARSSGAQLFCGAGAKPKVNMVLLRKNWPTDWCKVRTPANKAEDNWHFVIWTTFRYDQMDIWRWRRVAVMSGSWIHICRNPSCDYVSRVLP